MKKFEEFDAGTGSKVEVTLGRFEGFDMGDERRQMSERRFVEERPAHSIRRWLEQIRACIPRNILASSQGEDIDTRSSRLGPGWRTNTVAVGRTVADSRSLMSYRSFLESSERFREIER